MKYKRSPFYLCVKWALLLVVRRRRVGSVTGWFFSVLDVFAVRIRGGVVHCPFMGKGLSAEGHSQCKYIKYTLSTCVCRVLMCSRILVLSCSRMCVHTTWRVLDFYHFRKILFLHRQGYLFVMHIVYCIQAYIIANYFSFNLFETSIH